jgi:ABC transporter substrate binding protein
MPVVGVLSGLSPAAGADALRAFRQGLSDTSYVEHQNIEMEYRWAEGRYDRLPAMAADLVSRQVAVILTTPTAGALAAKAATATIPVVFLIAGCRQPQPARRQPDGCDLLCCPARVAPTGGVTPAAPRSDHHRRAREPERTGGECRAPTQRPADCGECARVAAPCHKCRQRAGRRGGVRSPD